LISKIITDACNHHSVVICTQALPDAGWPEGLKTLPSECKASLRQLLGARDVQIITHDEKQLVQQRNAGEALIASLLQFPDGDRVGAFAQPRPCEPPYLVVRPVNLLAGRDHIVLRQTNTDYASPQELTDLANSVSPLFADEGLALFLGTDLSRWFLKPTTTQGERFLALKASDSQQALGRNIDAYMTTGDEARRWRRLETEVQMTWFEHPVNNALQARGQHELNSIWIEGSLSAVPQKPQWLTGVISNRPELKQLGNAWHLQQQPFSDLYALELGKIGNLCIFDAWHSRLSGDAMGWLSAWEALLDPTGSQFEYLMSSNAIWVLAGEENLLVAIPKKTGFKARINRLFSLANTASTQAAEKALMLI
jgi:hypothetical protein